MYLISKQDDEDRESVDSDLPLVRLTSPKQGEQQSSGDECVAMEDSVVDENVIYWPVQQLEILFLHAFTALTALYV